MVALTRRHWLGLATALTAAGAASSAIPLGPPAIRVLGRGERDPRPMLDALAAYAGAEMAAFGLPGLSMAVTGPDGLRATLCLGLADIDRKLPVTPDQLFQIGSISKSLVALCLYRLADQGKVDLDAPAANVLPDIPWPDARITIATMLNHTSGLPGDAPTFPRSPDGRLWTNYPPGQTFAYSNTTFDIFGMMIARIARMPFPRAMVELVLRPLKMSESEPIILTRDRARYPTGYWPFGDGIWFPDSRIAPGPWLDIDIAAGSIAATPADMARYLAYLVQLGRGQGAPLISNALARRYVTATTDAPDFSPNGRYASGIATVDIDDRRCLHHTGGMILFHSSVTVDWQAGGGVFASANSGTGSYRPRGITHHGCRLLRAFVEGRPLPPAPAVVAVPPVHQADLHAGRFLAANAPPIVITANGDALSVSRDGVNGRLFPISERRFAADSSQIGRHEILFDANGFDHFWWGGTRYARGEAVATPVPTSGLRGFAGLYTSNDPWVSSMSIIVRGDSLVLEGVGPLSLAPDGSWRQAVELPSGRFWFDAFVDGRAQRLSASGTDLLRFHDTED